VWDPFGAQMLLFGGQSASGGYLDDLWAYTPTDNRWTPLEPPGERPAGRVRHSAVWDSTQNRMLVFGGYSGLEGGYTSELWAYRPTENTWTEIQTEGPEPPPRGRHGAVWDPGGQQMLVFGGYVGGVDFLGDLWRYRPSTNEWARVAPGRVAPGARADLGMVWDPTAGQLVIFGGSGGDQYADVWSYRPPRSAPSRRAI
jgi:N-acetylneuraminic acid mutarotase